MDPVSREKYLKLALRVFGVIFIAGVFTMMHFWPAGFAWTPRQPEYEHMIVVVYAIMGIFMWLAARDPSRHTLFIWFIIWSSVAHGGVMLVHALMDSSEGANLIGDIPGLFIVAIVLGLLMPRNGLGKSKPPDV